MGRGRARTAQRKPLCKDAGVSAAAPDPARSARLLLPSGTVTFAFSDIEGSTQRWDRNRAAMQDAVRRHDGVMREATAA